MEEITGEDPTNTVTIHGPLEVRCNKLYVSHAAADLSSQRAEHIFLLRHPLSCVCTSRQEGETQLQHILLILETELHRKCGVVLHLLSEVQVAFESGLIMLRIRRYMGEEDVVYFTSLQEILLVAFRETFLTTTPSLLNNMALTVSEKQKHQRRQDYQDTVHSQEPRSILARTSFPV